MEAIILRKQCDVCMKPGPLKCQRCGLARYCSKECQKKAWIEYHKKVCDGVKFKKGVPLAADIHRNVIYSNSSAKAGMRFNHLGLSASDLIYHLQPMHIGTGNEKKEAAYIVLMGMSLSRDMNVDRTIFDIPYGTPPFSYQVLHDEIVRILSLAGVKFMSIWSRERVSSMDVDKLVSSKYIICSPVNYEVATFNDDIYPAFLLIYDPSKSILESKDLPTNRVIWYSAKQK